MQSEQMHSKLMHMIFPMDRAEGLSASAQTFCLIGQSRCSSLPNIWRKEIRTYLALEHVVYIFQLLRGWQYQRAQRADVQSYAPRCNIHQLFAYLGSHTALFIALLVHTPADACQQSVLAD